MISSAFPTILLLTDFQMHNHTPYNRRRARAWFEQDHWFRLILMFDVWFDAVDYIITLFKGRGHAGNSHWSFLIVVCSICHYHDGGGWRTQSWIYPFFFFFWSCARRLPCWLMDGWMDGQRLLYTRSLTYWVKRIHRVALHPLSTVCSVVGGSGIRESHERS